MERCAQGDSLAFEELHRHYIAIVRAFVVNRLPHSTASQSTDDILQEVFIRVWLGRERWTCQAAVATWILSIASNVIREHKRKRLPTMPLDENVPTKDVVMEAILLADSEQRVHDAVNRLPAKQKQAIRFVYL